MTLIELLILLPIILSIPLGLLFGWKVFLLTLTSPILALLLLIVLAPPIAFVQSVIESITTTVIEYKRTFWTGVTIAVITIAIVMGCGLIASLLGLLPEAEDSLHLVLAVLGVALPILAPSVGVMLVFTHRLFDGGATIRSKHDSLP
jgi:hypothetical protein